MGGGDLLSLNHRKHVFGRINPVLDVFFVCFNQVTQILYIPGVLDCRHQLWSKLNLLNELLLRLRNVGLPNFTDGLGLLFDLHGLQLSAFVLLDLLGHLHQLLLN